MVLLNYLIMCFVLGSHSYLFSQSGIIYRNIRLLKQIGHSIFLFVRSPEEQCPTYLLWNFM